MGHSADEPRHMVERFVTGIILTRKPEPGLEGEMIKELQFKGKTIKVEVQDITHSLGFPSMRELFLKKANGVMLVYSITDSYSFVRVKEQYEWIKDIRNYDEIPKVVVGNNCDKESEREVSKEEGKQFADSINAQFIEASAKGEINVNEAFMMLIDKLVPNPKKDKDCIIC